MALYEVTGPGGEVYEIEGPDDADPSAVIAQLTGAQRAQSESPAQPTGRDQLAGFGRLLAEHPFSTGVGFAENALSGITSGVGSLAEAVTGSDPGTYSQSFAYEPRTQAGQRIAELSGNESAQMGRIYDRVAGTGPLAQTLKERVPQAMGAVGTVTGVAGAPRLMNAGRAPTPLGSPRAGSRFAAAPAPATAEQIVSRLDSQQSMGAASAAPSLTNVSPELRQSIVANAQRTGGAINPDVLARHVEADTLPVRMRLTEGQATQDPVLISKEMNNRLRNPELAEHFDQQNRQLAQNLQTIRDEVGPEVFSGNAVEHGDALIAAYRELNDAAQTNISALYQRLRDEAGGSFPVNAKALLQNSSRALHKDLLFEHAPPSIMRQLQRFADGGMTFEQFEALRTNLATIQRSHTSSGLERRAAGVIRSEMEKLPLTGKAEKLKPLADEARAAARAQFEALDADPAYAAAVNETVTPDAFVRKFVIGGSRDNVAKMRANLANNERAVQTLGVATLDHLRDVARLNPHYEGNFASASFNKALQGLSPKLGSLLPPRAAELLEQLGNVARYTTSQPRGSAVNNSNTFVAGVADRAATAVEQAVNMSTPGQLGTLGREALSRRRQRNQARRAIEPGAGLDRLPERRQ
jgi:hypothetical protein